MSSGQIYIDPRKSLGPFGWTAITGLTAHLLVSSRIIELFPMGDALRALAISLVLVTALVGIAFAFAKGEWIITGTSIALLVSIWIYSYKFSQHTGLPFIWTSGGLYFPIGMAALFYLVIRENKIGNLIESLFVVCFAYAALYVLISLAFRAGMISFDLNVSLAIGSDELIGRQSRLVIATAYIVFGLMFSVANILKGTRSLKYYPSLVVFVASLYFANSRLATVAIVIVVLGFLISQSARKVGLASALALFVASVGSFYVMSNPEIAISSSSRDTSVFVRSLSLQTAQNFFGDVWLWGAGLPSAGRGYTYLTNNKLFYPSDIGMLGVIFTFGILGTLLYLFIAFSGLNVPQRLKGTLLSATSADALTLTAATLALWSVTAPSYMGASGAAFAALFVAFGFLPRWSFRAHVGPAETPVLTPVTKRSGVFT